ncbi:hypothetical protein BN132_2803 [Cronobacter turicensis 564]|nr:hypothetical protein BN132_2803 [Cronobacter turicensis 564]
MRFRIADEIIHRDGVYRQRDGRVNSHRLHDGSLITRDIFRADHHVQRPVGEITHRRGRYVHAPASIAADLRVIDHAIKEHRYWLAGFNSGAVTRNGQVTAFFRRVNDVICGYRRNGNGRMRLGDDGKIATGGGRVAAGIRYACADGPHLIRQLQHIRDGDLHAPAPIALRGGGIRFAVQR